MPTYTVLNTNDSGVGSLRTAITSANSNPGSTITFVRGLTGTITLTSGTFTISANMTITGPGSSVLNVQRSATAAAFTIFTIATAGITFNISGLTISNGSATSGGGMSVTTICTLNINSCIFQNNTASSQGGAIYNANNSTFNIIGCTFLSNTASGRSGIGGGICNMGHADINITSSIFESNVANAGAAFYNNNNNTVNIITINNCTFSSNTASAGCGIYTDASISVFNSTFNNNTSTSTGSGLSFSGAANSIVINCTFNGNSVDFGGAIFIQSSTVTMIGCTLSGNSVTLSTFTAGIFLETNAILNIGNTVVATNPLASSLDIIIVNGATGVTIDSLGYNFIGNATGTGTAFTKPGDHAGTTASPLHPLLLPLANNGGLTETMLPETTPTYSPLLNAGSVNLVTTYYIYPDLLDAGQPIDQRGLFRIVNNTVDIGSVETGTVTCFSGESKVLIYDTINDSISEILAKNVVAGIHEVYSLTDQMFVPVKINVVTGPINRIYLIKKKSLNSEQPNEDFCVTSGHKILINGVEIKARNIPQAKKIKVKPQNVYTICTENQTSIFINGLAVMTWSEEKFLEYAKEKNIMWKNNQISSTHANNNQQLHQA